MSHKLITHIIVDGMPDGNKKRQVSPICSNPDDMEKGVYFLGYNGSRRLSLTDLQADEKIHLLPLPVAVNENLTLWINADRKVFYRTGILCFPWTHISTLFS